MLIDVCDWFGVIAFLVLCITNDNKKSIPTEEKLEGSKRLLKNKKYGGENNITTKIWWWHGDETVITRVWELVEKIGRRQDAIQIK